MNKNNKVKTLSPKIDVVFQALFGEIGSERITKRFLECILNEEINGVDLSKNHILRREHENDKLGILDVFAKINGKENCNVEMQLADKEDILERILYYWSRIYAKQLKKGEQYIKLEKTIEILITDFEIKGLEELEYHSEWKIIEKNERKIILTDKLEIHIIEIPKVMKDNKKEELMNMLCFLENPNSERRKEKMKENEDELLDWLYFLENPNSERVKEKMKENKELREAVEKLNEISEDEEMQRIAELRDKAIRDEKSAYSTGLHRGIEDGIKQGIKQGEEESKKKIAKEMLNEGIDIEVISRITKLKKEEIEKL